jgi:general secretion pathway protein J
MRQRGLTLIEMLVAIFILAILAVLSYRAVAAMTNATQQVDESGRRFERLADTVDQIDRDLTFTSDESSAGLTLRGDGGATGRPGELRFPTTASAYRTGQEAAPALIGYRLHDGRLEKLVFPQPWMADDQPVVRVLLDRRVKDFRLRFRDRAGAWYDHWPVQAATGLPSAVEYRLELNDGGTVTRLVALP